jgi:hypothetical protein
LPWVLLLRDSYRLDAAQAVCECAHNMVASDYFA